MAIKENISGFFKKMFTNQIILYIILILAILNIVQYVANKNMKALTYFIAVGFILKAVTNNYSIILLLCLITTNIYVYVQTVGHYYEHKQFEGISGFRSRYKSKKQMKELDKAAVKKVLGTESEYNNMFKNINGLETIPLDKKPSKDIGDDNVNTYNEITEAYNNLVTDIKKKTKRIKELSKKIKL